MKSGLKLRPDGERFSMKKFEPWEIAFIQLAYPTEDSLTIAKHLNRSKASIKGLLKRLEVKIHKRKNYEVEIGKHYDNIKVIKYLYVNPNGNKVWECLCDCGRILKKKTYEIMKNGRKKCKCDLAKYPGSVSGKIFGSIRRRAKKKGIEFTITLEFIEELLKKQNYLCNLSDDPIYIDTRKINGVRQKTNASLDRIDSSRGYTPDNVQWLKIKVNLMKWGFTQDDYIETCLKVAKKYERSKNSTDDLSRLHLCEV
jgi:hypothetical protein